MGVAESGICLCNLYQRTIVNNLEAQAYMKPRSVGSVALCEILLLAEIWENICPRSVLHKAASRKRLRLP